MADLSISTARHDHRWTDDELKKLLALWLEGAEIDAIAHVFGVSYYAINKQIYRMRVNGIPVPRRRSGTRAGRHNKLWTQEEVEYVVRRRNERASAETIADELSRSYSAINGLIKRLRDEGVGVRMLGVGKRRLWNSERLRDAIIGRGLRVVGADEEIGEDLASRHLRGGGG